MPCACVCCAVRTYVSRAAPKPRPCCCPSPQVAFSRVSWHASQCAREGFACMHVHMVYRSSSIQAVSACVCAWCAGCMRVRTLHFCQAGKHDSRHHQPDFCQVTATCTRRFAFGSMHARSHGFVTFVSSSSSSCVLALGAHLVLTCTRAHAHRESRCSSEIHSQGIPPALARHCDMALLPVLFARQHEAAAAMHTPLSSIRHMHAWCCCCCSSIKHVCN